MVNDTQASSVLEVNNLQVHFPITAGIWRRTVGHVTAVDEVRKLSVSCPL